jgi:geranylgeranyl transferase type-2 subunit beta
MPSYLEALTVRLAQGVARLDELVRARHAGFLRRSQNVDGGFSGREGASDLYYTGFALRGLSLVGELDGEPAHRAATYLRSRLSGEAPVVDFCSLIYGAALLRAAAGIDVLDGAAPTWRDAVAETFESFRRADGGYAKTADGQSSSTYHSFLVLLALQLIDREPREPQALAHFARSRQRADGGFVEVGPMRRSGTNPTAAAIGTLLALGALDAAVGDGAAAFLLDVQADEGGLLANTRVPLADLLSTFTGVLTLADLRAADELDLSAARRYVESLQLPDGGFHGGTWDGGTDVEYTFYGLGALALL